MLNPNRTIWHKGRTEPIPEPNHWFGSGSEPVWCGSEPHRGNTRLTLKHSERRWMQRRWEKTRIKYFLLVRVQNIFMLLRRRYSIQLIVFIFSSADYLVVWDEWLSGASWCCNCSWGHGRDGGCATARFCPAGICSSCTTCVWSTWISRCRKKKQIVPRRNILRCYDLETKDYVSTLRIRKERRNPITNEGDMPFARQGNRAYSCEIKNHSNRFVILRTRGYLKYISVGIYPKATAGPGTPVFGNCLSVL